MRATPLAVALTALVTAAFAAACGDGSTPAATVTPPVATAAPAITIDGAWARVVPASTAMTTPAAMPTPGMGGPPGPRSGVFMVIKNAGTQPDALIGATSDLAAAAEVHETVMQGDQSMMRPVDRLEIPAGGEVELKPGGYHVMLIGLKGPLQAGSRITIGLQFEHAGLISVEAEVRER